MSYEDAIKDLLVDKIDAMVMDTGKPALLFKKLEKMAGNPEMSALLGRLHFLPITNPRLLEKYYVPSTIDPPDYAWVKAPVPTVALTAILVHYTPAGETGTGAQMKDLKISELYGIIRSSLDDLKTNGHPKWKEVDLQAPPVKGWKSDPAVVHMVDKKRIDQLFD